MPGSVVLVGAGEFLPGMAAFDRELLGTVARARPRVVILPTASAPSGESTFRRWAAMGVAHFAALGAEVEPVLVRTVADGSDEAALQAIGEADLVYLSSGKLAHLGVVLNESPLGEALRGANARGAIIAGCSAGATALGGRQPRFRRSMLPWPMRWDFGLGLLPGVTILPHYDAWPESVLALMALQAPRGVAVIGIDEDACVVANDTGWQVHGRARVTVWRGRERSRFHRGEEFHL